MKETKLLGTLMPSHPDVMPIIEKLRKKYKLGEISPDDDPIKEIYLGDKVIPLKKFLQEIEKMVQESELFITPESKYYRLYRQHIKQKGKPPKFSREELRWPKDARNSMMKLYNLVQPMINLHMESIDQQHAVVARMIYVYILTGESEEAPSNWFSNVVPVDIDGEIVVFAMASQVADPEIIIQQFRQQYKKSFGIHKPKVTNTIVSTAYYMQLQRLNKKWDYIVDEFIRLNNYSLPGNKNSEKNIKTWNLYSRRLRKRIERSEDVLKILLEDKK